MDFYVLSELWPFGKVSHRVDAKHVTWILNDSTRSLKLLQRDLALIWGSWKDQHVPVLITHSASSDEGFFWDNQS